MKKMLSLPIIISLILLNLSDSTPVRAETVNPASAAAEATVITEKPAADAAVAAAQNWLQVVDSGQFGKSWEEAAPIFQKNVQEDSWSKLLSLHREPLGQIRTRELRSKNFFTSLPGAPEGSYWVLDFVTTFGDGKKLYERVTPMKIGEREWKVSGYFLNPAGFSN